MLMKNPPHPGLLVQTALDELGVSTAAAARALGVTRQQLHNVVSGKSAISPEMALRLEHGIGSTADTWLRMQAAYDLARILSSGEDLHVEPLVPRAAAE
jgi:addiction module HigA family antidote